MNLTQAEADHLLSMPKTFEDRITTIDFPRVQAFQETYTLIGENVHEQFLLDLERGNIKRARLKFQTRARKIFTIARIDIDGRPHRNPPDSPHRPNERFTGTHIHLYRVQFGDRIAFLPEDLEEFSTPTDDDAVSWLAAFLRYCNVDPIVPIQEGI